MKKFVKIMKALSDPNRVKILKLLQQRTMCVCEIHSVLAISQPAVSNHLKILSEAGLVKSRKEGLWVNYRLSSAAANEYVPILLKHITQWANQDSLVSDDHKKMKKADRRKIKRSQ